MYTGGEKRCILIRVSMFISFLRKRPVIAAALAGTLILATGHAAPGELDRLRQGFLNPPDDARVMMRWWWFGSAVTKPELEREMRVMKEGGIGGFEVQPVYPLALDDPAARLPQPALSLGRFPRRAAVSPARRRANSACAWT